MLATPNPPEPENQMPADSPAQPQDSSVQREPTSQGKTTLRAKRAAWLRDMPQWGKFKPEEPNPLYKLIDEEELANILKKYQPDVQARVKEDIKYMEDDLMRLFRIRDHSASFNQNRYRKYQILYILLAALATMVGSFQALALFSSTRTTPWWGFLETVIALLVTFLAVLISRESPLTLWLENRRKAEQMRREYFRFLVNLPPYDALEGAARRKTLGRRAADINRGLDPDQTRSVVPPTRNEVG